MEPSLEMDDEKLLAMIRKSPENWKPVWSHLWSTHREAARAIISNWEKDELEQDEIFDKSLIIFRRKVLDQSFLGQSTIRTFIIGICRTLCRQRHSRRKQLLVSMTDELQHFIDQGTESHIDLLEDLYTREETQIVHRVIKKIENSCQQLFREYYWQQLSQKEMAAGREMQGESSIKNKLLKCRRKMKELLLADQQAREVLATKIAAQEKIQQRQLTEKARSK